MCAFTLCYLFTVWKGLQERWWSFRVICCPSVCWVLPFGAHCLCAPRQCCALMLLCPPALPSGLHSPGPRQGAPSPLPQEWVPFALVFMRSPTVIVRALCSG